MAIRFEMDVSVGFLVVEVVHVGGVNIHPLTSDPLAAASVFLHLCVQREAAAAAEMEARTHSE